MHWYNWTKKKFKKKTKSHACFDRFLIVEEEIKSRTYMNVSAYSQINSTNLVRIVLAFISIWLYLAVAMDAYKSYGIFSRNASILKLAAKAQQGHKLPLLISIPFILFFFTTKPKSTFCLSCNCIWIEWSCYPLVLLIDTIYQLKCICQLF